MFGSSASLSNKILEHPLCARHLVTIREQFFFHVKNMHKRKTTKAKQRIESFCFEIQG